jgi:hypothetical protein
VESGHTCRGGRAGQFFRRDTGAGSVHGTFHAVSPKYLQTYLDEFSFRYNHRGVLIPDVMFSRVSMPAKAA